MKTNLIAKLGNYNFEKLFAEKGYAYFTKGNYNLNIIGIRRSGNKVTNTFDDVCVVIYKDNNDKWVRRIYNITTLPGASYMGKEMGNSKGTAILVPGQYRGCWEIGLHKGKHTALVQRKPVKVYRDNDKDQEYDFEPTRIDTGCFGINLHRAGVDSYYVNNWSAGCQVWKTAKEHTAFMELCKRQILNGRGKTFTYTLLNEEDL